MSDALALFCLLQANHGHIPGKTFALDHNGMKQAGLTDLSRERFNKARNMLIEVGLLTITKSHIGGKQRRQYQLCRPLPEAENLRFLNADIGKKNGERA